MRVRQGISILLAWLFVSPVSAVGQPAHVSHVSAHEDERLVPRDVLDVPANGVPVNGAFETGAAANGASINGAPSTTFEQDSVRTDFLEPPDESKRFEEDDFGMFSLPVAKPRTEDDRNFPTLHWSGFLQLDSGWLSYDETLEASIDTVSNRTGLRRVRLRAFGDIREHLAYVADFDFAASGHPSFRDVMLRVTELPLLQEVRLGYFQQPFGMDARTSGQELAFLERRLPFAFAPFRQTAIGSFGTLADERLHWGVSVYRFPTDSFGRSIGDQGGFAVAQRITALPIASNDGRCLLHLGFGHSMGDPGNDLIRYQIQPGFFVSDSGGSSEGDDTGVPAFVDTGDIPTSTYNLFAFELAGKAGPFYAQSQVTYSIVDQIEGPPLGFHGVYAFAGYFLTGESRPYNPSRGVFTVAEPLREVRMSGGGPGAWEVVAGWSYIDLTDQDVVGGILHESTLGLNWYINSNFKCAINATRAYRLHPIDGDGEATFAGIRFQAQF